MNVKTRSTEEILCILFTARRRQCTDSSSLTGEQYLNANILPPKNYMPTKNWPMPTGRNSHKVGCSVCGAAPAVLGAPGLHRH